MQFILEKELIEIFLFYIVAFLLALITLVVARPRKPEPRTECGECVSGELDVTRDVVVTEPPATDVCATGIEDVSQTIPPAITTDPPLC